MAAMSEHQTTSVCHDRSTEQLTDRLNQKHWPPNQQIRLCIKYWTTALNHLFILQWGSCFVWRLKNIHSHATIRYLQWLRQLDEFEHFSGLTSSFVSLKHKLNAKCVWSNTKQKHFILYTEFNISRRFYHRILLTFWKRKIIGLCEYIRPYG